MRMLFLAAGSPATVFALAPLATAARNAGHDVVVAATEDMTPVVAGVGLPSVAVTSKTMRDFMFTDREGGALALPEDAVERMRFGGHGFGRLAADCLDALLDLGRDWRPDLVVGGALAFGAALAAARLSIPYVGHAWDMGEPVEMERGAAVELRPELDRLGLNGIPEPDLWVEICPPSVAAPEARAGRTMRFVPYGRQQPLRQWMYLPAPRRRVCVTAGSRVSKDHDFAYLEQLVDNVSGPDLEVVIAAPEDIAALLNEKRPDVRAGWLPLDVVLRTCDLLVHAGGGQTSLTAMHAGVPQLIVPNMPKLVAPSTRLAEFGAAITLAPGEDTPEAVAEAGRKVLDTPTYGQRSRELAAEMATLPGPAELLPYVERLA